MLPGSAPSPCSRLTHALPTVCVHLRDSSSLKQLRPRRGDKEGMTTARLVLANDVIHIQRRTREGFFFLVPVPQMVRLICFAYALAAADYERVIHVLCIMGTHVHVIVTDFYGQHQMYYEYAHRPVDWSAQAVYGIEGLCSS